MTAITFARKGIAYSVDGLIRFDVRPDASWLQSLFDDVARRIGPAARFVEMREHIFDRPVRFRRWTLRYRDADEEGSLVVQVSAEELRAATGGVR